MWVVHSNNARCGLNVNVVRLKVKLVYVIAAVIAFIFLLVAIHFLIVIGKNRKKAAECTVEVTATVTGRREQPAWNKARGVVHRTVWTLEYAYGGVKYVESSQDVPFHTDVGSTLVIHLDRDNPKRFYVEGAAKRSYVYGAIIAMWVLLCLAIPVALVALS